jgi:hypothetical protein
MEIQQSMLRSYHAFANSHLLISVTFSTPTGDSSSELVVSAIEISQQLGSRTRAKPQLIHTVVEALYHHCPRNLKVPNSIKHRPSARLNYPIWRSIHSEGILLGLARDRSTVRVFPYKAIKSEN